MPSRRSVPGTFPVSTVSPVQSSTSSTIWKAIPSEPAEGRVAAAEDARGREQRAGLQRAALEVRVDGRLGIVPLAALHRLAAGERERRVGEDDDLLADRRAAASTAKARAKRWSPAAFAASAPCAVQAAARPRRKCGAVDDVVVDQRGHVHELDGHALGHRRRALRARDERT